LAAGSVNFALGEPADGSILMSFVVVVMAITFYQERKTERAVEALRDLSSPRALVVRDGVQQRIAGRDVVRGDIVLLAEGDRVPADGVMLECTNLAIDESLLTGESVPVRKFECGGAFEMDAPGGDGTASVFSGTLAVKGQGVCLVRAVGAHTELGRIGTALDRVEPERTRLQREIDRLVGKVLLIGLGLCVAVVTVFGLTRGDWLKGVLAGITMAMAILPEEFPVVLTVFLALGAWRLSQRHVLVRRMPAVETLGSATVLCVDKTGTLTANRMTVCDLVVDGEGYAVDHEPLRALPRTRGIRCSRKPSRPFDPMDTAFKISASATWPTRSICTPTGVSCASTRCPEHLLALSHVWRSPDGSDYVIAAKGARGDRRSVPCHPERLASIDGMSPTGRSRRRAGAWHALASMSMTVYQPSSTTSTSSSSVLSAWSIPCANSYRPPCAMPTPPDFAW
jgi:Ca2+-transporting ATPase